MGVYGVIILPLWGHYYPPVYNHEQMPKD
jgi:hypothetical protein